MTPSLRWRDVVQNPRYQVSDTGLVRNATTLREKQQFLSHAEYWCVALCLNNNVSISRNALVHRLVAAAFIGACPTGLQVNHIDGNRRNNLWQNLEYVTLQQNLAHARAMGLDIRGERNGSAKLTKREVLHIRRLATAGARNHGKLAVRFGVSRSLISLIAERRVWTHV